MNNQQIPGMAHPVAKAALYGCGLCHNPAPYMCAACQDVSDNDTPEPRSIIGSNVPSDFMYV